MKYESCVWLSFKLDIVYVDVPVISAVQIYIQTISSFDDGRWVSSTCTDNILTFISLEWRCLFLRAECHIYNFFLSINIFVRLFGYRWAHYKRSTNIHLRYGIN